MDHGETKLKVVCICGDYLQYFTAVELVQKYDCDRVVCIFCEGTFDSKQDMLYACSKLGDSKYHSNGYGFCAKCAQIIYEQEKHNSSNPKFYDLLYQRLVHKMSHILQNKTKIGPDSVGILMQLLRWNKDIYNFYHHEKKEHFSKKDEFQKEIESFAFSIFDIKHQFECINRQILIIDNDDQPQIAKLYNYCTLFCFMMMRLHFKYNIAFKEYYYKFKQQQDILYNKLKLLITANALYYCTCGRIRIELSPSDFLKESDWYKCYICNRQLTIKSKPIFECEYGGIGCVASICHECISNTDKFEKIKLVNFRNEFDEKADNDYSQSDGLNKNVMCFLCIIFDKLDKMMDEECKESVFNKFSDHCQQKFSHFAKYLNDDNKKKLQLLMCNLLRKRLKMRNNVFHSNCTLNIDESLIKHLRQRSRKMIEIKIGNLITINLRKYLFNDHKYKANDAINPRPLSMIDQILHKFDYVEQKEDVSENIILGAGIRYARDEAFRFHIIAKSLPLFIQWLCFEIYLFCEELNWCLHTRLCIRKVSDRTNKVFKILELEKLKSLNVSMYVKIIDIKAVAVEEELLLNYLRNIYDIELFKKNYQLCYSNMLEKLKNKKMVNDQRRYWYELHVNGNELKKFWGGKRIISDVIKYNIVNDTNDTNETYDSTFNEVSCLILVQKSGNIENMFKIEVRIAGYPSFVDASVSAHYFIPQLQLHRCEIHWSKRSRNDNGEFCSDLLKFGGSSTGFDVYFSLQFHFRNRASQGSHANISCFSELQAAKQTFEQKFNKLIASRIETSKFNASKQLHTLQISGDKKIRFDKGNVVCGETFDLFPFPIFDYVIHNFARNNSDFYIPLEVASLIKQFTPNPFKSEYFKIYLSIYKSKRAFLRINFNAVSSLRCMQQINVMTQYWMPQILHCKDNVPVTVQEKNVGYNTKILASKLESLDSFEFNVGLNILHSNMEIINKRKEFLHNFCIQQRNAVIGDNEKHKITLTASFEMNGEHLQHLFEGKKGCKWPWIFGAKMACDITPESASSHITTIELTPSCCKQNGYFYHGIDFAANKDISKILVDLHFIREEMMDGWHKYNMSINQGGGRIVKCLASKGFVEMKDMEYTSFTTKIIVHILKMYGFEKKGLKELVLKKFECLLCQKIYYQSKQYEKHLQSSDHRIRECHDSIYMDYTQRKWHQINSF